jgi:hypothetical protein
MKRVVFPVVALICIAGFLLNCGGDSKATPPSPTFNLAFLQQKPNSTNLVYPILANLAGTSFTTYKVEDESGQQVSAAMASIILNNSHNKAVFDVYGGTVEGASTNQWDLYIGTLDGLQLTQITNDPPRVALVGIRSSAMWMAVANKCCLSPSTRRTPGIRPSRLMARRLRSKRGVLQS